MTELRGVITAMATPFDSDGGVDLPAARRLARHLLENGSNGLVVAGTTGESPTLTDDEQIELLRNVVDEVGSETTLVCGTGTNDTRHSAELTAKATEAGADAVLVVTPYYNKPTPPGIVAHFREVAAATDLPVVVYNIPSRTIVNIPPDLLEEVAQIDNVVAVKQANNDELRPIEGLDILAGNDNIFLRTLEIGGSGGILVASHVIGNEMRAVYEAAQAGDLDRARGLDAELQEIYEAMSVVTNPIPVKAALAMLGLDSGRMRLPLVEAEADDKATIRVALEHQGLLEKSTA